MIARVGDPWIGFRKTSEILLNNEQSDFKSMAFSFFLVATAVDIKGKQILNNKLI
jgi:hypothetical protein